MGNEAVDSQQPVKALEARLRLLEDREAIHEVIMRYCRGVDRGEPDLVASAFHDDATDNHYGVLLPFREAIGTLKTARSADRSSSPVKSTMHNICNVLIEIDGDVARSESYLVSIVRLQHEARAFDWTLAGRYVDRFERRNGAWRIAQRTVVYDHERFDEVMPAPDGLPQARYIDRAVRGKRGPDDFSYEIFGSQTERMMS
jgi:hypothetical protein